MKHILKSGSADQFVALILDNEVTVGEFVASPPLPWTRLELRDGIFAVAPGSPTLLTADHAKFEMKNWDEVALPAIARALAELGTGVDYVLFGNNAGQGLPLAQRLPAQLIGERGGIIYAQSLPEKSAYERLGYKNFSRRSDAVATLHGLAKNAGKPLALFFVNTIQHNERNYHDP